MPAGKLYSYSPTLTVASYTYIKAFLLSDETKYVQEMSIYSSTMQLIVRLKIKGNAVVEWNGYECQMAIVMIEKSPCESTIDVPDLNFSLMMSCIMPLELWYNGVQFRNVDMYIKSKKDN